MHLVGFITKKFPNKFLTLAVFVNVEVQQYLTPACVSVLSAYQISLANSTGSIISSSERQMKTFTLFFARSPC
jgi:hypothetical protein